jgi:hypothetical protein
MSNCPKRCPKHGVDLKPVNYKSGKVWECPESGCTVKCLSGPTSTPADSETRHERLLAHDEFDALWERKKQFKNRGQAYAWLASYMCMPPKDCHIGNFNSDQCRQLRAHIKTIQELGYNFTPQNMNTYEFTESRK